MSEEVSIQVESGLQNEDVLNLLDFFSENDSQTRDFKSDIDVLKKLVDVEIQEPKANRYMGSLQPWQIIDRFDTRSTRPSMSYTARHKKTGRRAPKEVAQIIRDGIKTIQEDGGYIDVLDGKPSIKRQALMFGNGLTRMALDNNGNITWDVAPIDSIYVDNNSTTLHSANVNSKPTRMAVIYSYDIHKAQEIANVEIQAGRIPTSQQEAIEFDKKDDTQLKGEQNTVEKVEYFDIGGDEPIYIVAWGSKMTLDKTKDGTEYPLKGDDYPFIDREGKPFIPMGKMMYSPTLEGFFDNGILGILYKYIIARRNLWNKQFGNTSRSLTDLTVLNAPKPNKDRAGTLQMINDARRSFNQGNEAIIINETGEPMTVSKLQANQYEQGLEQLKNDFDTEFRRMGINLDVIRATGSATATQIREESGAEDETIKAFIARNRLFFVDMEHMTMDFVSSFIKANDDRPIRTTVRIPKRATEIDGTPKINQETGLPEIEEDRNGETVFEEIDGITYGTVKQLLDEYRVFVEANTLSGIRQKDFIQSAKADELLAIAADIPAIRKKAIKIKASAVGIDIDDEDFEIAQEQPVPQVKPLTAVA